MLEAIGVILAILAFCGWMPRLEKSLARVIEDYPKYTNPEVFMESSSHLPTYGLMFVFGSSIVPPVVVVILVLIRSDTSLWIVVPMCAFIFLFVWMVTALVFVFSAKAVVFALRVVGFILKLLNIPPSGVLGSIGLILAAISAWQHFQ